MELLRLADSDGETFKITATAGQLNPSLARRLRAVWVRVRVTASASLTRTIRVKRGYFDCLRILCLHIEVLRPMVYCYYCRDRSGRSSSTIRQRMILEVLDKQKPAVFRQGLFNTLSHYYEQILSMPALADAPSLSTLNS